MSAPVYYHAGTFPPRDLEWSRLIPLLGPTAAAVARYDGILAAVPNPAVLLSPLTTQEAVLSSRIEGRRRPSTRCSSSRPRARRGAARPSAWRTSMRC